jgi:outer membrane beta-barrel protein
MRILPALLGLAIAPSAFARPAPLFPPPPPLLDFSDDASVDDDAVADEIDDILSGDAPARPASSRAGIERDEEAAARAAEEAAEAAAPKKKLIKTLQRKTFMKIGRGEIAPMVGFVTNDPFLRRYVVGLDAQYHVTEVFALDLHFGFSPDFGRGDWKPITIQIFDENQVTPDISKLEWYTTFNFDYSPIYGKVAVGRTIINFDIFGLFGAGIVNTKDDLEALDKEDDQFALATQRQIHPALSMGGGARVVFGTSVALRVEVRTLSYIETIESTTLELKNNVMFLGGVSFLFPGTKS